MIPNCPIVTKYRKHFWNQDEIVFKICTKDQCAWYDGRIDRCCMLTIATELHEINVTLMVSHH